MRTPKKQNEEQVPGDTKKLGTMAPDLFDAANEPGDDSPAGKEVQTADRIEFEGEGDPTEEGEQEGVAEEPGATPVFRIPEAKPNGTPGAIPTWAAGKIPKMRLPRGVDVLVIRIPAKWTPLRQKGDRILVLWELSEGDEKMAFGRGQGDAVRATSELAKQCIRSVDGHAADWSGDQAHPGCVDRVWREIGAKGRNHLIRLSSQLNHPSTEQVRDFFENCIAAVSTA